MADFEKGVHVGKKMKKKYLVFIVIEIISVYVNLRDVDRQSATCKIVQPINSFWFEYYIQYGNVDIRKCYIKSLYIVICKTCYINLQVQHIYKYTDNIEATCTRIPWPC